MHFFGFKQKSLFFITFQSYFINSQGMLILFLNNSVGKLSGYLLSDSLTIFPVGIWKYQYSSLTSIFFQSLIWKLIFGSIVVLVQPL